MVEDVVTVEVVDEEPVEDMEVDVDQDGVRVLIRAHHHGAPIHPQSKYSLSIDTLDQLLLYLLAYCRYSNFSLLQLLLSSLLNKPTYMQAR